jgi:hypothetical protein
MIRFYISVWQENMQYKVHGTAYCVWPWCYLCLYLFVFIIISYFGQMIKCVEFPWSSTTVYSICSEFYITALKMTTLGQNVLPE